MNERDDIIEKPASKKALRFLQLLIVFALLGAGGKTIYDISQAELSAAKSPAGILGKQLSDEDFARLNERLDYVEAHIKSLEETLANIQKNSAATVSVDSVKPSESLVLEAKLEELQTRVDMMQKTTGSPQALQHVSLLSTFGQLQKIVHSGKPFSHELTLLTQFAAGRPATLELLKSLQPFAEQTPQTLEALQQQFQKVVSVRQESTTDSNSLMSNLHSLVRVRKEGQPQGDDDESIIARAESAIKNGDVETSARELQQLSNNSRNFFNGWIGAAQNHIKIQAALSALEMDLVQPQAAP